MAAKRTAYANPASCALYLLYCIQVDKGRSKMATSVVSGRVDEHIRKRAERFIRAAGTTPGDIIRCVWEHIASTGEVPAAESPRADLTSWEQFMSFRQELPEATWLSDLSDQDMRDMIAKRYA